MHTNTQYVISSIYLTIPSISPVWFKKSKHKSTSIRLGLWLGFCTIIEATDLYTTDIFKSIHKIGWNGRTEIFWEKFRKFKILVSESAPQEKMGPFCFQNMIVINSNKARTEIHSRVVGTFGPGSKDRVQVNPHHFTTTRSPVQLDWFIKGRVVCGLSAIHSPKRPLGIIRN
jgi:hypothetical protein